MRILVTGGSSFLGAPLVRRLAAAGDEVRVLSRGVLPHRLGGSGCRIVTGDIRDEHAVARAAFGCDTVIHLAYARPGDSPRDIMDTAVNGMASVLRACELHTITDLMLVTSAVALEAPRPPGDLDGCYGAGKQACELMAAAWARSGAFRRVLIPRVYNAYGPDMGDYHVIPQFIARMARLAREHPGDQVIPFPVRGAGLDIRSFIYIDDCTSQLMTLLRAGSPGVSHYDVGLADERMTTAQLANAVAGVFGRTVRVVPSPAGYAPSIRVPRPAPLLTGSPHVPLGEGLKKTAAWYRDRDERGPDGQ